MTCCIACDYSSLMPRPQHEQANPARSRNSSRRSSSSRSTPSPRLHPEKEIHTFRFQISRMKPASTRRGRSHGSGRGGVRDRVRCGRRDSPRSTCWRPVCAATGAMSAVIMPTLNDRGRQPVLGAVRLPASCPPGWHAVLIWDGAGFHTGEDVVVPSNVSLIQLPPYSPELNPVENLWHYLRAHHWSNRLYREALVQRAPDAGAEGNVVAAHQAVVDDHALERQQDRLRQDRQVGADQFLERLREGQDAVGDGLACRSRGTPCTSSVHGRRRTCPSTRCRQERTMSSSSSDRWAGFSSTNDWMRSSVIEEGVTDLEANFRRQRSECVGAGNIIGHHLEALVHEEHQRPVQLEEQFDILGFEQHGVHQS